jgi:N-acetylmuramoyl-L-alanine amidase
MPPQVDSKARKRAIVSAPDRTPRNISAMLFLVRNFVFSIAILLFTTVAVLALPARTFHAVQEGHPQPVLAQAPPAQQPQQPTPAPPPAPAPVRSSPVVVLDPAHGGTDTGARGEGGLAEKDIVLQIARTVREQLERQGFRVLMTRNDDSNPSYDDRAAVANAHRDVIFISLHVASTGMPGTARAYYDGFSSAISPQPVATSATKPLAPQPTNTLVAWDQAQRRYLDASHQLADLIQIQLAQGFSGSPVRSMPAPVRTLRSVMGPAVAIEISSISGSTADALVGAGGLLSAAITHGIWALRPSAEEVK